MFLNIEPELMIRSVPKSNQKTQINIKSKVNATEKTTLKSV